MYYPREVQSDYLLPRKSLLLVLIFPLLFIAMLAKDKAIPYAAIELDLRELMGIVTTV